MESALGEFAGVEVASVRGEEVEEVMAGSPRPSWLAGRAVPLALAVDWSVGWAVEPAADCLVAVPLMATLVDTGAMEVIVGNAAGCVACIVRL